MKIRLEITLGLQDNTLCNDIIGMVSRLVYLVRRIAGVEANYWVE